MTENEEGTQTQTEGTSAAQTDLSKGEGVQPLSQPGSVSQEEFNKLVGVVTDLTKQVKGRQARADKFENTMTKKLNELGIEITPDMQKDIKLMDMEEKLEYLETQLVGQEAATSQPQTSVDHAEIITKAGLNPSDPKLVELAATHANDALAFAIEVGKIKATPPPAAASTTMPATQANPPTDADLSSLNEYVNKYTEALNSGNQQLADRIRTEAKQKHGNAWDNVKWDYT
jgi:hypothetical protein